MHTLRSIREARQLSLRALSRLTGIPLHRLASAEKGACRLTSDENNALETALACGANSLPPVPTPGQLLASMHRETLTAIQADGEQLWTARWSNCQRYLESLDVEVELWFQRATRIDSDPELVGCGKLIGHGALPDVRSPVTAGFLHHPLIDPSGRALGVRLKTCLVWNLPHFRATLWPQVSMRLERLTLRVDQLVLLERGSRRCWCVLELDGPQHTSWGGILSDRERDQALGLPVIRLEAKLAYHEDFHLMVQTRLEQIWANAFPRTAA